MAAGRRGPVLRRVFELLEAERDVPVERVLDATWPLVQPGMAFRQREKDVARVRGTRRGQILAARLDDAPLDYKIMMGARVMVRDILRQAEKHGTIAISREGGKWKSIRKNEGAKGAL